MQLSTMANRTDDEDLFAHTRMSFGDHIEELRMRMIRAILGFVVALVIGLFLGQPVLDFIQAPVQRQLEGFYDARIARQTAQLDAEEARRRDEGGGGLFDAGAAKEMLVEMRDEDGTESKTVRLRFNTQRLVTLTARDSRTFNRPA